MICRRDLPSLEYSLFLILCLLFLSSKTTEVPRWTPGAKRLGHNKETPMEAATSNRASPFANLLELPLHDRYEWSEAAWRLHDLLFAKDSTAPSALLNGGTPVSPF